MRIYSSQAGTCDVLAGCNSSTSIIGCRIPMTGTNEVALQYGVLLNYFLLISSATKCDGGSSLGGLMHPLCHSASWMFRLGLSIAEYYSVFPLPMGILGCQKQTKIEKKKQKERGEGKAKSKRNNYRFPRLPSSLECNVSMGTYRTVHRGSPKSV